MKSERIRLGVRYARILAAFGIWIGTGAAAFLLAAGQWFFGSLLVFGSVVMVVMTIDGRRLKERVYTKFDLITQGIVLVVPVVSIAFFVVVLGRNILNAVLPYVLLYLLGLVVVLALAINELRRGLRE